MVSGSPSGNIPNKCQVRGAGGQKGPQDSPQVPVRERAELGSTQQAPGNVRRCKGRWQHTPRAQPG